MTDIFSSYKLNWLAFNNIKVNCAKQQGFTLCN